MAASVPRIPRVLVLAAVAAALSGCGGSNASFPFDRETVWRAAVGEAIVWRPNRIDENDYVVESTKAGLGGVRYEYWLKLRRDPNPFARRPSTTLHVRMGQIAPETVRFTALEQEFLLRVKARVEQASPLRLP